MSRVTTISRFSTTELLFQNLQLVMGPRLSDQAKGGYGQTKGAGGRFLVFFQGFFAWTFLKNLRSELSGREFIAEVLVKKWNPDPTGPPAKLAAEAGTLSA